MDQVKLALAIVLDGNGDWHVSVPIWNSVRYILIIRYEIQS